MAQIQKIDDRDVGTFKINFSLRSGLFEVELMPKNNSFEISKGKKDLRTYQDALDDIERLRQEFLFKEKLIRKVIIIQLQTSESDYISNRLELGHFGSTDEKNDLLENCLGFEIRWIVAEEYQMWDGLGYKIIDAHDHYQEKTHLKKISSIHNLLYFGNGYPRIFNYREDLHQFLKTLDGRIRLFLQELISYFDTDGEKFLQNFEMSKLNLLTPKEE